MTARTGSGLPDGGVSGKERFDCWRELIGRTRASEVASTHVDEFDADMRRLELGPVTLLRTSFPSTRFWRTGGMVRRSDPEVFSLTLLLDSRMALIRDSDPTATFGPGELHLAHSSQPFDLRAFGTGSAGAGSTGGGESGQERRVEAVGVDFPAALLPLEPHRLRNVLGRGFSGREGTCALLSDFRPSSPGCRGTPWGAGRGKRSRAARLTDHEPRFGSMGFQGLQRRVEASVYERGFAMSAVGLECPPWPEVHAMELTERQFSPYLPITDSALDL